MLKRPHVAVSPDQKLFVRDRGFDGIAFWRLDQGDGSQPTAVSELVTGTVKGLGFNATGVLVTLDRSAELSLWDVSPLVRDASEEPVEMATVRLPLRGVVATAFSRDRRLLAVGDEHGTVAVVDISSEQPRVAHATLHADQIVSLAFAPNSQKLASSGRDRVVRVWSAEIDDSGDEAADLQCFNELHGMEGWAITLAFDSAGERLATGAMDNGLYLFGLADAGELSAVRYVHLGWVADVEWSPDETVLMTASWDTTVGLFEVAELAPQLAFEVHHDYVVDITFIPETPFAVSASYDRTAVVWNWQTREAVAQLGGHSDWVHFVLPISAGRVATICSDSTARIWDTDDWTCVRELGRGAAAGVDVGSAVDLSEYVGSSDAPKQLESSREPTVPVTRFRDMRSALSLGTGQTAMALLQSALQDAPGVEAFMTQATSAPSTSTQPVSFDPVLPEVVKSVPRSLSGDSEPAQEASDGAMDAAAAFENLDVSAVEEAPVLDVPDPEIDLPEAAVEPELQEVIEAQSEAVPEPIEPELADTAVDLPQLEISADPEALLDAPAVAPQAEEAEPKTLEMSPSMLDDLDDLGEDESSVMKTGVSIDPYDDGIEEERSPTMDGTPNVDLDAGMPDVDDAWADLDSDVLQIEEASIGVIEPAVDMTGPHPAIQQKEIETAEAPRIDDEPAIDEPVGAETSEPLSPGREGSFSTVPGRPPVDADPDDSEASAALSAAAAQQEEEADEAFVPRFKDVSETDSEGSSLGDSEGTLGYHVPATDYPREKTSPRSTQQLHGVQEVTRPEDEEEPVRRRERSKTAVGGDLSEDSTFQFFFGNQPEPSQNSETTESAEDPQAADPEAQELSEESTFDFFFSNVSDVVDDEDEARDEEYEATSRLVPDRHFSGDFGKSPEVFETTVAEIWAARPEKSNVMMGILKKPNRSNREFRSAFAIRTYHQWVYSVVISPDGDSIASCGGNNLVCVWSKTGDLLHQLRAPSSGFNEVKFTPDGTGVVAAGDDGRIHIWMLPVEEYGRIRHAVLDGHEGVVSSIAFTPEGRYMLSGSFDGTARVWDMSDGRCRVVLEDHDGPVSDVAIAGRRAYSVGHDGTVRIWDDRKWLAVDVFDGFDKLLSVASNGVIHAWTAANGDVFCAEDGRPRGLLQHRGEARGVCVTEAGMVVTAGQDAQLRIYQRGVDDPSQSLLAPASLWSLDVTDGVIAAGGDDGKIHIFRN